MVAAPVVLIGCGAEDDWGISAEVKRQGGRAGCAGKLELKVSDV